MTLGLCFWVLMLLWLILGGWAAWSFPHAWGPLGHSLILFALLLLLGWKVFGAPLHN